MAAIPEVVKIGPYRYTIHTDQASWDELKLEDKASSSSHWGYTDNDKSKIYVKPNVGIVMQRVVVVHELMHGAIFVAGEVFQKKRSPEFFILHITPTWLAILQDNPQLVDFLIGDESDGEA